MSFKPQTEFLAGVLVIFTHRKQPSEILGFLNHVLVDDLNICLDSQYTRILEGLSEIYQWSYSTTQRTPQKCQQN